MGRGLIATPVGGNNARLRVLFSYHYYKDVDLEAWIRKHTEGVVPDIFADSGAWSAYNANKPIDREAYADWLERWGYLFTAYSNLDVINDPAATLANQTYLESRGLNPIPVFHVGDDFRYLNDYLETGYRYIGLGGMAGRIATQYKQIAAWLGRVFRLGGDVAFHGFGVTSWRIMQNFRWFSMDSTSWLNGERFGAIPIFNPIHSRFYDLIRSDARQILEHEELIRAYGFKPSLFAVPVQNKPRFNTVLGGLAFMNAERHTRHNKGEIAMLPTPLFTPPLPPKTQSLDPLTYPADDRLGLRIYLGDTTRKKNLAYLYQAMTKGSFDDR